MTPNTNGNKKTPAEVLAQKDLTLNDVVAKTKLCFDAVERAIKGGKRRIKYRTAELVAEALGMKWEELEWPIELTNRGRTPLTGGNYTVGVGSTVVDDKGVPLKDAHAGDELYARRIKKQIANSSFCSNPEHNLLLPLSGVCALCAA